MDFISKRIRYFVVAAQEKSITRAAERLFITPSPLSKRIKELEENLNITLFERTPQGLSLTREGEFLYNDIITHYEKLDIIKDKHKGRKVINAGIYGPTPYHTNGTIEYFLKNKPSLIINLARLSTNDIVNRNSINQYDLLFTIQNITPSICDQHFYSKEAVLLVHPAGIKPTQYKKLPIVMSPYFAETREFKQMHSILVNQGYSRDLMHISDMQLRREVLHQGNAISLVLESMFPVLNIEQGKCQHFPLVDLSLTHHIFCNTSKLQAEELYVNFLLNQKSLSWFNNTEKKS